MPNASSAAQSCEVVAFVVLLALVPLPVMHGSGASAPFPRLAGAPSILSTSPAAGELNVSLAGFIEIRYSEAMNASTLSHAILPFIALNATWPQPDLLRLTPGSALVECTPYRVGIYAEDADEGLPLAAGNASNPWSFMTTCDRPFILATAPADGANNVLVGTEVVVTFSEPMKDQGAGRVSIDFNPTAQTFSTTWGANFTRFSASAALAAGTRYTVTVTGQDLQGNDLVPGLVPNPWRFTVNGPPRVSAPTLSASGCLDAGSALNITWTLGDDVDAVGNLTVTLSYRNGTGLQRIVGPAQGFTALSSYTWVLPAEDVTTNVTVKAEDSALGVTQNWSQTFRVDTGPPRVLLTNPQNNSLDVPYGDPIAIVFSEPMNHSSVEAAFSATPSLPGAQFLWPANETLQVDPGGLIDRQRYDVAIRGTARDTCGVGQGMGQDFTFSFTTSKAPAAPPARLTVTDRGETFVTVVWDPVTIFVTGRPIPSGANIVYLLYRADEGGPDLGAIVATTSDLSARDASLRPETSYVYRIVAVVDGVPSTPSAPVRVATQPSFFTTREGGLVLVILATATVVGIAAWGQTRRRLGRARAEAQLEADVEEVVELVRKASTEPDPAKRRVYEEKLESRFLALVQGPEERGELDPRLDGLYRALARRLVRSPGVDIAKGRNLVDTRLGTLSKSLVSQGASYRILSEAEASHASDLFHGLPESAKKALLLVYFYALEEYLSHRLRELVPHGATVLLGERGHINVRLRGWEQQWAALTLGNLLYLLDHNRHLFLTDENRWEEDVEPFVHQTVDARNRTAHPSREAPPLDRVRELIYTSLQLLESVLKAPKGLAA